MSGLEILIKRLFECLFGGVSRS